MSRNGGDVTSSTMITQSPAKRQQEDISIYILRIGYFKTLTVHGLENKYVDFICDVLSRARVQQMTDMWFPKEDLAEYHVSVAMQCYAADHGVNFDQ